VGGLGHLGIQFAAKMGFRTFAIARGRDKEPPGQELGASEYNHSQARDPAAELVKLGGARVILANRDEREAMSAVIGGLAVNGKLIVLVRLPNRWRWPSVPLMEGAGPSRGGRPARPSIRRIRFASGALTAYGPWRKCSLWRGQLRRMTG